MSATYRKHPALPTGAITFLFTDIEGSTTLWEQHPDAMRAALSRHDVLLRHAIESFTGTIVKTTGDGVYAVFGEAADALAACLAAQRALQAPRAGVPHPELETADLHKPFALRVRMGLHTGPAELRDDDYFGASVIRASRIMSVAHGEQILLSSATAELVCRRLPGGVTLRNLGTYRLKGLRNPERLLQVVAPDLRVEFPPLMSLTGHSLPAERDAFVGRSEPLAELTRLLGAATRLITVLGIGGTGKTRLVTRFGWGSLGEFPGGVWFCDLAQARSLDGIAHAVAHGLDVPLGKDDPVVQLGHAIAGRGRCLVVLDNFEQVARHAEATLGRWLNRAADAQFLVTTREVLGLPGEHVLALPPLAVPDAVALFTRRAEAAMPGFAPSAEEEEAIALLVELLEGLPLAIELAAARVRVMPPRTLLERMGERFKLLASTGGRVDRQATLRAVFDWSWDLLSLPEKAALAQLSVFEGGFTLGSVEAILDLSQYRNAPWPMDALQSLVHKSLVRKANGDRFDLLVSVQEYAAEHLRTAARYEGSGPAALLAAELRHGAHFSGMAEMDAIADNCAELDNLVVACRRAVARGDVDTAVRCLEGVWSGLNLRGPFRVGVELATVVQALSGLDAAAAARVNWVAGRALEASGKNSEAYGQFETSLARAREAGDRRCECRALISLGFQYADAGRLNASRAHREAGLALARELEDRTLESDARNGLGILEEFLGHLESAKAQYEAGLALAREAGDEHRSGRLLGNLGGLYADFGRMDKAAAHFEAALSAARGVGDRRLECITLGNLGWLKRVQEMPGEALVHLEDALEMARDMGLANFECFLLHNLGLVCEMMARLDEASDHFEKALVAARKLGDQRSEGQLLGSMGKLRAHQSNFGEARLCLDSGEALLHAVSDRVSLSLLLCNRAESEHLARAPDAAKAALAEADLIALEIGSRSDSELGRARERVRALLEQQQRSGDQG